MELSFLRPDEVAGLTEEERGEHVHENSDLCVLNGERFFIRAVLPLPVASLERPYNIGLWVELERPAFLRVCELWSEPGQANEPPFSVAIANAIPSLTSTLGLPAMLQLTGPTTRPQVQVEPGEHRIYHEQVKGIDGHRVYE